MPLTKIEEERFVAVAKFFDVAPNKLPMMIKLAGKIKDENNLTEERKPLNLLMDDLRACVRIWITPGIYTYSKANQVEALSLCLCVVILAIILRYFYDSWQKSLFGKIDSIMTNIISFTPFKSQKSGD